MLGTTAQVTLSGGADGTLAAIENAANIARPWTTANCVRWVDFWGIYFNGQPSTIVYIGPGSGQITSRQPGIAVTPGSGQFFISGGGFAPGSSVSIIYNYTFNGDVTTNSGSPSIVSVDSSGGFTDIVDVSTLLYSGTLDVQATDNNFGALNATTSVSF